MADTNENNIIINNNNNNSDIIFKAEDETTSSNGDIVVVTEEEETAAVWGTLEELLLVCAVNRHGTTSWDSIAEEMLRFRHDESFSADNCRQKYVDLKRRFFDGDGDGGVEEEVLRMVEELRKLRVEQLKREVHNHDVSIVSLQMKVKKLEEEREISVLAPPPDEEEEERKLKSEPSDLRAEPDGNEMRTGENDGVRERSSPENKHGGDSAEDRSVNESNSASKREPEEERGEPDLSKPSRPGESGSESKQAGVNNNNNHKIITSVRQQSSDVQSSASLSKKKRRRFRGVNSSGDELEAEEISPANKRINVKSQPLIRFLDTLLSHKHGSVFQRRLPSQETEKYRNVIRRHMDLLTVQNRLDRGTYSECHSKFYRDLLLIFTNAVLFYRKSSAEHIAARELRRIVMDEISLRIPKPETQPSKPDPELQHPEPVVKKPRSTTMIVSRRRTSSAMQALSESMKKTEEPHIATSNNSKPNSNNSKPSSGKMENGRDEKEKPKANSHHYRKKVDGSSDNTNDIASKETEGEKLSGGANSKKVLTRERSSLSRPTLRLSNTNSKKIINKEGNKKEKVANANNNSKEVSSEGERAEHVERKKMNDQKQGKGTILKKQGVANFLKRMKQNSPSSQEKAKNQESEGEENGVGNEEVAIGKKDKNDSGRNNSGRKAGGNQKRNNASNKDSEVSVTRRTSGRRGEKEPAAAKRSIGRPPKRKAAMMGGNTPDSGKGGRAGGRDGGDKSKKKPKR